MMKYDEINYWSEVKLDIIREFAQAYSTILSAQTKPKLYHIYIDAFAGAGIHISKRTNEFVAGSPLNALLVEPPFKEYHFVDLDGQKIKSLKEHTSDNNNVSIYEGDCNHILVQNVFPHARYEDYKRGLCLLDPYGLHLNWQVLETAGKMKSIDVFLNFPVADMNRNVLWKNPDKVTPEQIGRMNAFWGDESWRQAAYDTTGNLFGFEEKTTNLDIVKAFQKRLKSVAEFKHVPNPIPMRNYQGATVYYLFFASHKPVAETIVQSIFKKYKEKGSA